MKGTRPSSVGRSGGRVLPALGLACFTCFAVLAVVGVILAPESRAQESKIHTTLREFQPTGRLMLVAQPASPGKVTVYFSQRAAAFLVRGSALGQPLLVRTGAGTLESVPEVALVQRPDGGWDVLSDAPIVPLGRTSIQGGEILIHVPGLSGKLTPPPPLLGWHKVNSLDEHTPEYGRDAMQYRPDLGTLDSLRLTQRRVQVFMYFGSWCSTCKMLLGRVMRLDRELASQPNVSFDYYGIPAVPHMYRDPEVTQRGIQKLPTGIVYIDGKFAAAIIGTAWNRPESVLKGLLETTPTTR